MKNHSYANVDSQQSWANKIDLSQLRNFYSQPNENLSRRKRDSSGQVQKAKTSHNVTEMEESESQIQTRNRSSEATKSHSAAGKHPRNSSQRQSSQSKTVANTNCSVRLSRQFHKYEQDASGFDEDIVQIEKERFSQTQKVGGLAASLQAATSRREKKLTMVDVEPVDPQSLNQTQTHYSSSRRSHQVQPASSQIKKKVQPPQPRNKEVDSSSHRRMHQAARDDETQIQNKFSQLVCQVPQGADKPSMPVATSPKTQSSKEVRSSEWLLGPQRQSESGRKTLVLDLDETLVHSSFKPVENPDITLPVEIDGQVCMIYVLVRPFVAQFLKRMHQHYELVIFTASLSKYADPLMKKLDPETMCSYRLFREHCTFFNNAFVKDLTRLGRQMKDIIIVDNSPVAYLFQPENAVPAVSWYDDPNDDELMRIATLLERMAYEEDVRKVIRTIIQNNKIDEKQEQIYLSATINNRHRRDQSQRVDRRPANIMTQQAISPKADATKKPSFNPLAPSQKNNRQQPTFTSQAPQQSHSRYDSSDTRQKHAAMIYEQLKNKKQEDLGKADTIEIMLQRVQADNRERMAGVRNEEAQAAAFKEAYEQHKMQIMQLRNEIALLKGNSGQEMTHQHASSRGEPQSSRQQQQPSKEHLSQSRRNKSSQKISGPPQQVASGVPQSARASEDNKRSSRTSHRDKQRGNSTDHLNINTVAAQQSHQTSNSHTNLNLEDLKRSHSSNLNQSYSQNHHTKQHPGSTRAQSKQLFAFGNIVASLSNSSAIQTQIQAQQMRNYPGTPQTATTQFSSKAGTMGLLTDKQERQTTKRSSSVKQHSSTSHQNAPSRTSHSTKAEVRGTLLTSNPKKERGHSAQPSHYGNQSLLSTGTSIPHRSSSTNSRSKNKSVNPVGTYSNIMLGGSQSTKNSSYVDKSSKGANSLQPRTSSKTKQLHSSNSHYMRDNTQPILYHQGTSQQRVAPSIQTQLNLSQRLGSNGAISSIQTPSANLAVKQSLKDVQFNDILRMTSQQPVASTRNSKASHKQGTTDDFLKKLKLQQENIQRPMEDTRQNSYVMNQNISVNSPKYGARDQNSILTDIMNMTNLTREMQQQVQQNIHRDSKTKKSTRSTNHSRHGVENQGSHHISRDKKPQISRREDASTAAMFLQNHAQQSPLMNTTYLAGSSSGNMGASQLREVTKHFYNQLGLSKKA